MVMRVCATVWAKDPEATTIARQWGGGERGCSGSSPARELGVQAQAAFDCECKKRGNCHNYFQGEEIVRYLDAVFNWKNGVKDHPTTVVSSSLAKNSNWS